MKKRKNTQARSRTDGSSGGINCEDPQAGKPRSCLTFNATWECAPFLCSGTIARFQRLFKRPNDKENQFKAGPGNACHPCPGRRRAWGTTGCASRVDDGWRIAAKRGRAHVRNRHFAEWPGRCGPEFIVGVVPRPANGRSRLGGACPSRFERRPFRFRKRHDAIPPNAPNRRREGISCGFLRIKGGGDGGIRTLDTSNPGMTV